MVHESSEKNAMRGLKRLAERKKYFLAVVVSIATDGVVLSRDIMPMFLR